MCNLIHLISIQAKVLAGRFLLSMAGKSQSRSESHVFNSRCPPRIETSSLHSSSLHWRWKIIIIIKVTRACGTPSDLLCFPCRLKAAQGSKTITSLLAINCPRRILLTGTPVQNNLDEFFGRLGVIKTCIHCFTASGMCACKVVS